MSSATADSNEQRRKMHYDKYFEEIREEAEVKNWNNELARLIEGAKKLSSTELRALNALVESKDLIVATIKQMNKISKILNENESA